MVDCLSRRKFLELTVVGLIPLGIGHFTPGAFAETRVLKVFKSPSCGCCGAWVDHMRGAGFRVEAIEVTDLSPIKNKGLTQITPMRCYHGAHAEKPIKPV